MKKKAAPTKSRVLDKIGIKKSFNKIIKPIKKGKFKKPEDEEKKSWIHEEEDWKKDELEEPEEKVKISVTVAAVEDDDLIEKDVSLDDDETTKILDEDFLGDEDKDNY
ncbi:MAG: hypothetical protein Q7S81_00210 [bacterium]|nr:hypothetical protein [bacterium]